MRLQSFCISTLIAFTFPMNDVIAMPNSNEEFEYGYFLGSLSTSCLHYKEGDISAKEARRNYKSIISLSKERLSNKSFNALINNARTITSMKPCKGLLN